jgi:WD40 repeat protein
MKALFKYGVFVVMLVAVAYAVASPDLPFAYPFHGDRTRGKKPAVAIPSISLQPSQVLGGLQSTGAIDYSPEKDLTATGEEGWIKVWQLPDEKPVSAINAGEGFQALQLRFLPGKGRIAACGRTADGKGGVRIFDVAFGKQVFQIETQEPVLSMDFDASGRYLAFTGMSHIKVWDLLENQAVSILPRDSAGSRGLFFMEDRFILQSDTLSLYDWKSGKKAAGLDAMGPADLKKINDNLSAWMSVNGLHTLRSPYGKMEFIPFNTQGIYAFDLAPDGEWGLFLRENKTMSLIDCTTGLTVKTVMFKLRPDVVFIDQSGASAYLLYGAGNIEIFDVGNENIFRNAKFYTTQFFSKLWNKAGAVTKNLQRVKES